MTEKRIAKGILESRAQAAFLMNDSSGVTASQIKSTYTTRINGRQYVVIDGTYRRLAVYRVRAYDGFLRMMRRWPKELKSFDPQQKKKSTKTFFTPETCSPKNEGFVMDPFESGEVKKEQHEEDDDLPPWRSKGSQGSRYVPYGQQDI